MTPPKLIATELMLSDSLTIEPLQMLEPHAATQLPLEGDHVPLSIFDKEFDKELPTLTAYGHATIHLSLGRPFGFMTGNLANPNKTQLTSDLTLTKRGADPHWILGVQTKQPLSLRDEQIFMLGAYKYASIVQWRIRYPV